MKLKVISEFDHFSSMFKSILTLSNLFFSQFPFRSIRHGCISARRAEPRLGCDHRERDEEKLFDGQTALLQARPKPPKMTLVSPSASRLVVVYKLSDCNDLIAMIGPEFVLSSALCVT
jgi:hypothetical protein